MSWVTSRNYVLPDDADAFSNGLWFNLLTKKLDSCRLTRDALIARGLKVLLVAEGRLTQDRRTRTH
jgi:hypothetical protein